MSFPLFLIPILAGLIAQLLKPWLNRGWRNQPTTRDEGLPRYGGMPSAHLAFFTSLLTVVGIAEGVFTTPFAIAAALWIFTLDDAVRMRMFLGRYGQAIDRLIKQLPPDQQRQFPYVEPHLGHTAPEAIAGSILGFVITVIAMFALRLT